MPLPAVRDPQRICDDAAHLAPFSQKGARALFLNDCDIPLEALGQHRQHQIVAPRRVNHALPILVRVHAHALRRDLYLLRRGHRQRHLPKFNDAELAPDVISVRKATAHQGMKQAMAICRRALVKRRSWFNDRQGHVKLSFLPPKSSFLRLV